MFKLKIEEDLKKAIRNIGFIAPDAVLSISENARFGDYSSNVPLQLAKQKHKNSYQTPQEIANALIKEFGHPEYLERVEVAGAGFLNFFIKDKFLIKILEEKLEPKAIKASSKRIIVEYTDPNTHKMLHIGHLLPLTLGESVARLLEFSGNDVFRSNYGSDIGLTVAKALYGIEKLGNALEEARSGNLLQKAEFLSKAYVLGNTAFTDYESAKAEINELTKKLYARASDILPLWEETKEWSLGYFDTVYTRFGTEFDVRINESEIDQSGKEIVLKNIGKVFTEDQGAVIFQGEKHGLHNRVFINSQGNPTYEAKELGLTDKYHQIFPFDKLLILSDKEQNGYFDVVIKAEELIDPNLKGRKKHLSYGKVRLPSGKMSSRSGNAISGEEMLSQVKLKLREIMGKDALETTVEKIAVASIKFSLLKYSLNSDIIYDLDQSISLHGDSGPYVMYTYARANSILSKSGGSSVKQVTGSELEEEERELFRMLDYFELVIEKAVSNYAPNELTNYLLNLSKAFNLFYEKYHINGSDKEQMRLKLVAKTADTIKMGLHLLGIESVEKM